MAVPTKGAAWYAYQKAIDELVEAGLESDGGITEAKLDINNAPTDTKRLAWNAGAGKMEWVTKEAAANDTGEVRMNAGDPAGYVDSKLNAEDMENRDDKLCLSQMVAFNIFAAQIM